MTTTIKNIVLSSAFLAVGLTFQACSLDEENPGGFTMEAMAKNSLESYQTLINQCYFGAERVLYGTDGFMELTEGDTDLWTHRRNQPGGNTQYFWFLLVQLPIQLTLIEYGMPSTMESAAATWPFRWLRKLLSRPRTTGMPKWP